MSNHVVAVNIVRQPSPFAPENTRTRTKSFVHLEGSVADLRKALLEDQAIQPNDKFYGVNGLPLSNNLEVHTKWTEALQGILVVGSENVEPTPVQAFAHRSPICRYKPEAVVPAPPVHAHIVKRVEEVPQLIYDSGDSDISDTKTVTEQLVVPITKPTCLCSTRQPEVPVTPPVVVISPVVETIPVVDAPVEIIQETPVDPPVVYQPLPQVVIQPESVVLKADETATSDCPCDACQVFVPQPVEPVTVYEAARNVLQDDERAALIAKSAIGYGFNISGAIGAGPVSTNYPVVAQLAIENVEFDATTDSDTCENIVVTVTSSARETAYNKSGWSAPTLEVQHPWAPQTDAIDSRTEEASRTVTVTGQYVSSKYELSLSRENVRPHPDFEAAIRQALDVENAARRSEELGNVFRQYGHVYVAAVELGGLKRASITRTLSEEETEAPLVEEVKSILSEAFTTKEVSDCPCPECANDVQVPAVANELIETIGGAAQASDDISLWKASLADPVNWAVTRIIRVESVIDLFDEVTRAKILAVVPQAVIELETTTTITLTTPATIDPIAKVPLHRLFSPRSGVHFYTTKSSEVDSAVRVHGYNYETLAAHILPEESENTVPLYRVHRGTKHLYTTDLNERAQQQSGHGLVGHVHATQQPGTVPLYRIFNPRTDAHLFTTNVNEKESLLSVGWSDEGVTCYVYL